MAMKPDPTSRQPGGDVRPSVEAPDLTVLRAADAWLRRGDRVWLATVLATYGSAPRPVGSMAVLNDRGDVVGSVSGGCIEDDIADWLQRDAVACETGRVLVYGQNADERARLRLPCNGHLRLWLEPAPSGVVSALLRRLGQGQLARRVLDIGDGTTSVSDATPDMRCGLEGSVFVQVLGPTHRLILIGASEISRYLAPIAQTLGFAVHVVDPRREYLSTWPHPGCTLSAAMPDDYVAAAVPDDRTAVVALSHDPKLDDLALMVALKGRALYVGAMGSVRTTAARKKRLQLFDVTPAELERLHGPVGVDVGARTPPEIAVSIAAELVRVVRPRAHAAASAVRDDCAIPSPASGCTHPSSAS